MIKRFRRCGLVVGGKGVYIWFLAVASFGNIPCWNGILPKIGIQQEQTKRDFVIEWVVKERECIEFT